MRVPTNTAHRWTLRITRYRPSDVISQRLAIVLRWIGSLRGFQQRRISLSQHSDAMLIVGLILSAVHRMCALKTLAVMKGVGLDTSSFHIEISCDFPRLQNQHHQHLESRNIKHSKTISRFQATLLPPPSTANRLCQERLKS